MFKIKYYDVEVEFDPVPIFITAGQRFRRRRRRGPLAEIESPVGLVSSSLFALAADTVINTPVASWRAAPLLKPLPDGKAMPITSGFPVTGIYDLYGQLLLASALGSLGLPFTFISDLMPEEARNRNLICFGSPTSNLLSGEIFDCLQAALADVFSWGSRHASFCLQGEDYHSGNEGVAFGYTSPWHPERRVLVLAGIGPMGTLACCKLVTAWEDLVLSKIQRKAKRFIASVRCGTVDGPPVLRRFVPLA